jgi:hypothetical protein
MYYYKNNYCILPFFASNVKAASNNHGPNKCNILFTLGLPDAIIVVGINPLEMDPEEDCTLLPCCKLPL